MGNLTRTIIDTNKQMTTALPAQNTSVNSATIDLEQAPSLLAGNGTSIHPDIQFGLSLPATPSLANGQTITGTLQDSADNVTFANVAGAPVLTATGAGGTGGVAVSESFLPSLSIRRYLQVTWAASATAGNNTAISGVFNLLF